MQRKRGQQLVQSLERGLAALEMALDGSVRPSHVAEVLGIDRSTAYRLLYTLMAKGYLLQDERTREFTSNPTKFFQLYDKVATLLDWPDIAGDFLTKLRDQSGETANLGVRQANNVIYIAHKPGQAALSVNFALWAQAAHCTVRRWARRCWRRSRMQLLRSGWRALPSPPTPPRRSPSHRSLSVHLGDGACRRVCGRR